jgi:predicted AAA+ superfamily ATPase
MYIRKQQLSESNAESIFLFGARQTGKSHLLHTLFPNSIYIDLLETDTKNRFQQQPSLLREVLEKEANNTLVIIDEIQQVPELLNEVHLLISRKQMRFILCGSSARKLKRQGINTLGGRALPENLYPLVSAEITDFDLQRALTNGLLPKIYQSERPTRLLQAYVDIYLKEEIQAEALVRNLKSFSRFMEVAALTNGEIVNYNNIATDCGVSAKTVADYFSILQDTQQMLVDGGKYFDFQNNPDDAEFKVLNDYYGDAYSQISVYLGADQNLEDKKNFNPTKDGLQIAETNG